MSILSLIGIIYMAFSIVLIPGDLFFHLGNVIFDPIYEWSGTLGMISSIPYVIYLIIMGIFDNNIMDKAAIVSVGFLIILCLFGFICLYVYYSTCKKNSNNVKKAKKALKSLVNSDEYKQIVSENNRLRKNNEFMAEQWHQAWFEWVCSTYHSSKEAESEYEKEFMNDLGKQIQKTDFNESIKKNKK